MFEYMPRYFLPFLCPTLNLAMLHMNKEVDYIHFILLALKESFCGKN